MRYNLLAGVGLLACLVFVVGCRDDRSPASLEGGGASQQLDLSVSIGQGDLQASKAPVSGTAFATGSHLFGLAITTQDGVTAYETGSNHVQSTAVIAANKSQTWSHKWGSQTEGSRWLPEVYGANVMQIAAYYPYTAAAVGGVSTRDGGRLNVPFDLTTSDQLSNQTDLMYSASQDVQYTVQGVTQSVKLPFRHVYALFDFYVKLKAPSTGTSITKIEVCNKSGKSFLSNKGWFSPYNGALTAVTAGNVAFTTATEITAADYATIQVMVPPSAMAGYADGDIYVRIYDNTTAKPREFPVLAKYVVNSGSHKIEASGRYTYKLLYDNTALGSLEVVGWLSSTAENVLGGGNDVTGIFPLTGWGNAAANDELGRGDVSGLLKLIEQGNAAADATLGSGVPSSVQIGTLTWATGNLVSDGANGCKIGLPHETGLYFQFRGLIGYNSAPGSFDFATHASAWPSEMAGDPGKTWPTYTTDGVPKWYFSINIEGIDHQEVTYVDKINGVGDPCSYYLGAPWRTPTETDYTALMGASANQGTWVASANGRWFGINPGTASSSVFFPASGYRLATDGSISGVGTTGSYRTTTAMENQLTDEEVLDFYLNFDEKRSYVTGTDSPSLAKPVRCVYTTNN